MFEIILVAVVVLVAGAYLVRETIKSFKTGECPSCKDCHCGCDRHADGNKTPKRPYFLHRPFLRSFYSFFDPTPKIRHIGRHIFPRENPKPYSPEAGASSLTCFPLNDLRFLHSRILWTTRRAFLKFSSLECENKNPEPLTKVTP